jgi:hypothetical protein
MVSRPTNLAVFVANISRQLTMKSIAALRRAQARDSRLSAQQNFAHGPYVPSKYQPEVPCPSMQCSEVSHFLASRFRITGTTFRLSVFRLFHHIQRANMATTQRYMVATPLGWATNASGLSQTQPCPINATITSVTVLDPLLSTP